MAADHVAGEGASEGFDPAGAARQALAQLARPPAVLVVFVAQRGAGEAAAAQVAPLAKGAAVVVVECAGVLTSAGEHEGRGTAALALGAEGLAVDVHALPAEADAARELVARAAGASPTLLWLILTPPLYSPDVVAAADNATSGAPRTPVVGGGAAGAFVVPAGGGGAAQRTAGVAIALRARGLRAAATASPALRVLTPWRKLDEVAGNFLVSAGGSSMLEWIASTPGSQAEGSPTFVAVRAQDPAAPPLLRTVAGVDPRRGAVAVSEPIAEGAEVALGVWDGEVARQDLTARLATLARGLGGAAPVGAIVMTCLGRGQDLFGSAGVDAAAVRARFAGVPFAGMFSQFEIARFDGAARIHLYSASIAVLYRPS